MMKNLKVYPPEQAFECVRRSENRKLINLLKERLKQGDEKLYTTLIKKAMTNPNLKERELGKN